MNFMSNVANREFPSGVLVFALGHLPTPVVAADFANSSICLVSVFVIDHHTYDASRLPITI